MYILYVLQQPIAHYPTLHRILKPELFELRKKLASLGKNLVKPSRCNTTLCVIIEYVIRYLQFHSSTS